ncbi:hypothetical protein ACG98H_11035 [Corynebacterium sp. L4756]|uniref:hypothetical protein n=1 Tax=unclassified Corynebacterium TaxID=2624378 RepID=UPI00374CC819
MLFIFAAFTAIFGATGLFLLFMFSVVGLADEGIIFLPIAFIAFAAIFGAFGFLFRVTIEVSPNEVVISALRGLNKLRIPMDDVLAANQGPTTGLAAGVGTREYRGMEHCYIAGGPTVQIDYVDKKGYGESMLASAKEPEKVVTAIRRAMDGRL